MTAIGILGCGSIGREIALAVQQGKAGDAKIVGLFDQVQGSASLLAKDLGISVSCDGVCLTLIRIKQKSFLFYLSKETLKRSNFKYVKIGKHINIEKSLLNGQKISGHYVQGHVDSTAKIKKITIVDKTWIKKLELENKRLNKYLIEKASISINGVSLTISKIIKGFFEINVIPHTLKLTNLKNLKNKDIVNVELDIFGKYIMKLSN